MVKYDNIKVQITGEDGNGFFIVAKVSAALRTNGVSDEEVQSYRDEATSGNYDHLIQTTMKTVNVN